MMNKLIDLLDEGVELSIDESASEVDGKHVLAKVSGPFFVPDGISRNKRFYPKGLWEKTLKKQDIQELLKNRNMFGCISHNTPLNDESFRDGKFSHIVTKLGVNEAGKSDCEALILNTPTGRILNTVIRAGSKVFVSTRANGGFKGEKDGMPVVDEESYKLSTVDFVLRPGFLQASPALSEAIEELDKINNTKESKMAEKIEKVDVNLIERNTRLTDELKDANVKLETVTNEMEVTEKENASIKEELDELRKIKEEFEAIKEVSESVEKVKEIKETLEKYQKSGTVEEVEKTVEIAKNYNAMVEDLGDVEAINKTLDMLEEIATKHEEIIKEFGTKEEIATTVESFKVIVEEKEAAKVKEAKEKLAEDCKVKLEVIEKLWNKMDEAEIKETLTLLSEAKCKDDKEKEEEDDKEDKDSYKKDDEEEKEDDDEEENEDDKSQKRSTTSSLFESFN